MPRARILLPLLFALAAFADHAAAQEQKMIVFAAASLKDALDDVNAAYKQAKGVEIVTSYAGSGALIKQIEQGAPAEVFISADLELMDYGSQKKAVQDNSRVNLLGNRLVLIAPRIRRSVRSRSSRASTSPRWRAAAASPPATSARCRSDVTRRRRWKSSGCGPRCREARHGGECARWPCRWWRAARRRSASSMQTDAKAEPRVKVDRRLSRQSHPPIVYPAALTADGKARTRRLIWNSCNRAAARSLFEKRGFTFLAKTS